MQVVRPLNGESGPGEQAEMINNKASWLAGDVIMEILKKMLPGKQLFSVMLAGLLGLASVQVSAHPAQHHQQAGHVPKGAIALVVGGVKYWLKDDVYYQRKGKVYYPVAAPLGSTLARLPKGAVLVKRNGKPYYRYDNIYYRWAPKARNYVVVRI